ncbi:MAG: TonB-dependent receptor, partial [Pseudomonadota bacterium]|nr:TonB-dependent receptor [Pseudomonadota bacterium]
AQEWGSVNLRWRYFGEMDYVDRLTGNPLATDKLLCSTSGGTTAAFASCLGDGTLEAYNFFDLSTSFLVGSWGELTVGVNNIADKEPPLVGSTLALNGNAPGGYDQAGRFFFTSFTVKF